MAEDKEKTETAPDERARYDTVAGTGPGIPDDALGPGGELPDPPSDEQVRRAAEALGAPEAEKDTLPLDGA